MQRAVAFLDAYRSSYRDEPAAVAAARPTSAAPENPAAPVIDPDQVDQTGEPVVEEVVRAGDARTAAWLAFAQALFGSAEFRYLRESSRNNLPGYAPGCRIRTPSHERIWS